VSASPASSHIAFRCRSFAGAPNSASTSSCVRVESIVSSMSASPNIRFTSAPGPAIVSSNSSRLATSVTRATNLVRAPLPCRSKSESFT
jgi:hypothetical protein